MMIDISEPMPSIADAVYIQASCTQLITRYGHLADQRAHKDFAAQFAPDGEWIRPSMHLQGRDAIFRFMESRPPQALTRHVSGSIHIEVVNLHHARGISYTTVYREPAFEGKLPVPLVQPEMVVDYRDDFVCIEGCWYIARRHTTVVFSDKA